MLPSPRHTPASGLAMRGSAWVLLALCILFGGLSLWQMTEQDTFWLLRAGEELWRTRSWPEHDEWSFSARGARFWNVQWLASLLYAAVHALAGIAGLVLFRGVLVAALCALLGLRLIRAARSERERCAVLCLLLPLGWIALTPRLELRADTLVFLVFAAQLLREDGRRVRAWEPLAWSALAANLHVGTAPFVALAGAALGLARALPWKVRAVHTFVPLLGLFCTPYHLRVLSFWHRHFFYGAHVVMQNPDHQPLRAFDVLEPARAGGWALCWLLWAALAAIGAACELRETDRAGRWRVGLWALGALGLTAMSLDRVRAIPYHLLWIAPWAGRSVCVGLRRLGERALPLLSCSVALVAAATQWEARRPLGRRYGLSLSDRMYPIATAAFLARERPQPNLFHTFAFGAYSVYFLREYPTFVDTRETMFDALQTRIVEAYSSPAKTQRLLDEFGVHTTWVPIPKTEAIGTLGYRNVIAEFMPPEDWALVAFDRLAIVTVRRIPEHAALIARSEYLYLLPNLPPGNFLRTRPTGAPLARYQREIERCVHEQPALPFCVQSEAALRRYLDAAPHP